MSIPRERTSKDRCERTVPIQSIHTRERLLAPVACERTDVEVQVLVPLAVVLTSEALRTARPLALVRLLLVM
jgi:hypothetical protein